MRLLTKGESSSCHSSSCALAVWMKLDCVFSDGMKDELVEIRTACTSGWGDGERAVFVNNVCTYLILRTQDV